MVTMLGMVAASAVVKQMTLNDSQLDGLLTGNTVYLAIPPGGPGGPDGGTAPFLYGADGRAAAKLPTGTTLVGNWKIEQDRYCVDWENGPKNSYTKVIKSPEKIALADAVTGDLRGRVEKVIPGNPENL